MIIKYFALTAALVALPAVAIGCGNGLSTEDAQAECDDLAARLPSCLEDDQAMASCVSCHAPAHLPGLHAKKNHQTCTQCHQDTHDTALPTNQRKLCGACHQGLEKHEPDAPRCVSCHLFE